jgi:CIC family chloride channel protein
MAEPALTFFERIRRSEARTLFVLTVIVGALGGAAANAFQRAIDFFQAHLLTPALAVHGLRGALLVVAVLGLTGLVVGICIERWFPYARGSGIPEVKTAYVIAPGPQVALRTVAGKFVLAALSIGAGFSLGREGPIVQLCAGIGATTARLTRRPMREVKTLISVGAAAGIAAAFNTPIAAVTFALEELIGDLNQRLLGSIVVAAVAASVVERTLRGNASPLFAVPAYALARWWELFAYAGLGVLCGLGATVFVKALLAMRRAVWEWRRVPLRWLKPAIGGVLVALIGLGWPRVFGIGYDTLTLGLLGQLPFRAMATLSVAKLLATVVSYGWGVSGGIFSPTLFMGGMLGGSVGYGVQALIPGSTHAVGSFALVGMSAFFAGAIRAPITAVLIIFEMTGDYAIVLPLMIASTISYTVASALQGTPIYDALLEQDGIYLGEHRLRPSLRQATVEEVMAPRVVTATDGEPAGIVRKRLEQTGLAALPVVDGQGRLVGLVTREALDGLPESDSRPVGEIARRDLPALSTEQTLDFAIFQLGRHGLREAPVVEPDHPRRVVGMLSLDDVARGVATLRGTPLAPLSREQP